MLKMKQSRQHARAMFQFDEVLVLGKYTKRFPFRFGLRRKFQLNFASYNVRSSFGSELLEPTTLKGDNLFKCCHGGVRGYHKVVTCGCGGYVR